MANETNTTKSIFSGRQKEVLNSLTYDVHFGKALLKEDAGDFVFTIKARTELLGGPFYDRKYAYEELLVDPDADLEDNCLVVAQYLGGQPFLTGYLGFTGRNKHGKFVRHGDPEECYEITIGLVNEREPKDEFLRIIGRYVGPPRRFPITG